MLTRSISLYIDIDLVAANMERYFKVNSPNEKYDITIEILDEIHHSFRGRFLKRGNRCWVPVDLIEARIKVAQAIQYLRRKQAKTENCLHDREAMNFDSSPPPPELCRHEHFSPHCFNALTTANASVDKNSILSCEKYEPQQQQLFQPCVSTPMKRTIADDCVASVPNAYAHDSSFGMPIYPAVPYNMAYKWTKKRNGIKASNGDSCQASSARKGHSIAAPRRQKIESSLSMLSSCTTGLDASGIFSFPDIDSNCFEQDESIFCYTPL